ncbi:MAG: hypothetical protein ACRDTP_08110 [Mycobacteriales bacterium]
MPTPGRAVRSVLLAVQVFDDVDLELTDDGLVLPGDVRVPWPLVRRAVRGATAHSASDRARVSCWLRCVARLGALPKARLGDVLRPVGLPRGHVLHPGAEWVREAVLGEALDLGLGARDIDGPDAVTVVPPSVWAAIGVDPARRWPRARRLLEEMGALAATRWALSGDGTLRPMGDCDVTTLLGAMSLRSRLAGTDGGMRAVSAPMRRRGWTRLSRLDPAFTPAAAMATDGAERGFLRPLLVTADEVVLAGDGGRTDISLRDPVVERWDAPVLFR